VDRIISPRRLYTLHAHQIHPRTDDPLRVAHRSRRRSPHQSPSSSAGGCCHDQGPETIITEASLSAPNVQWVNLHEGAGKTTHRHSIYEKDGWPTI